MFPVTLLLLLLLLLLQICAVFAQLTVGGVWQGPHVFMVRIRDDKGDLMPGAVLPCRSPCCWLCPQFLNVSLAHQQQLNAVLSVGTTSAYTCQTCVNCWHIALCAQGGLLLRCCLPAPAHLMRYTNGS
jgi:hypothetical protein